MAKEIIIKKLEQLEALLHELEDWLKNPFDNFCKETVVVRGTERNFQLVVDIACDINVHILLERNVSAPDTYSQSFIAMAKIKIISFALAESLAEGAKLRNILVHEYDFIESDEKFYHSAKRLVPLYKEYSAIIYNLIKKEE